MTARAARTLAQAKVNLRLRVLAREASGYHQLETLFARLDLADEVVARAGVGGRSLDVRGADTGPVEQNLAWKAAMALRDAGGPDTFAIEIEKRIPVGGGLGGGSADAGAVLRALAALSERPIAPERLLRIAAALGSDVPFLTAGHVVALAWGRGERLLALPALPPATLVLAIPSFGIATSDAYRWLAAARRDGASVEPWELSLDALQKWEALAPLARNDFEAVVEQRHPELGRLREAMRAAGARIALLAGSGSTVFGVFHGGAEPGPALDAALGALGARVVRTRLARDSAPLRVE